MGIIDSIKSNVIKSGSNKEKVLFVRSGEKVRIRFLQEFDEGYEFIFHDSFTDGINSICLEELGKTCPYCGNEDLRTRSLYCWNVYNYDTKRVEIMLYAVNNCTPVAAFMNMYEGYGTILDRDYVITKTGSQTTTTYSIIPQDKQKFRNEKAQPYTKSAILKILEKAYPVEGLKEAEEEDIEVESEDYEMEESKKNKKKEKKGYTYIDDDDIVHNPKRKKKADKEKETDVLSVKEMEKLLDDSDIDLDEFLDYFEQARLKDIKKDKKGFKKLMNEYINWVDEDDDEDIPF